MEANDDLPVYRKTVLYKPENQNIESARKIEINAINKIFSLKDTN